MTQPPTSQHELNESLESYRPELAATPLSADAVRFLAEISLDAPARLPYRVLFTAAQLLQPHWATELHGEHVGRVEQAVAPHLAKATVRTIGWALDRPTVSGGDDAK